MVTRNDCNEMGASQWSVGVIGVIGRGAQGIWYKQMLLPEFNRTYQDIKNIDLTLMDLLVDIIAVGCLWGCFQEPLKSGCVALWHCGRSTADVNTSFATKEVTMY